MHKWEKGVPAAKPIRGLYEARVEKPGFVPLLLSDLERTKENWDGRVLASVLFCDTSIDILY